MCVLSKQDHRRRDTYGDQGLQAETALHQNGKTAGAKVCNRMQPWAADMTCLLSLRMSSTGHCCCCFWSLNVLMHIAQGTAFVGEGKSKQWQLSGRPAAQCLSWQQPVAGTRLVVAADAWHFYRLMQFQKSQALLGIHMLLEAIFLCKVGCIARQRQESTG